MYTREPKYLGTALPHAVYTPAAPSVTLRRRYVGPQATLLELNAPALVILIGAAELDEKHLDAASVVYVRNAVRVAARKRTPLWVVEADSAVLETLERLGLRLLYKDPEVAQHAARVGHLAACIGAELGFGGDHLTALALSAYLHDLGKIKLPLGILQKPQRLSAREWQRVTEHPAAGAELVSKTPLRFLAPLILQHHERADGSGYPRGLTGDEILLGSAIIAVADSYDAMTHTRPYQTPRTPAHTLKELRSLGGLHYPAEVVRALEHVRAQAL